jgi:hypothetical protein
MRYCSVCETGYADSARECAQHGPTLVSRPELEALHGRRATTGLRREVARVRSRFEADELAKALADEGLSAAVLETKASVVDPLTTPGPMTFAVVVPEEETAQARALVPELEEALESSVDSAIAAAETEEAAGEQASPPPAAPPS